MEELIFAGNKYISSKRASKLTGYTTDYIGQICRADKIDCRLVGRNWYIKEREVEKRRKSFKKEQSLGYKDKVSLGAQTGAIKYETISPELLYYSNDNDKRPLNPKIDKTSEKDEPLKDPSEQTIPVHVVERPAVNANRYVPRPTLHMQRQRRQMTRRNLPMSIFVASAVALIGVLFIAGTLTLERVIQYSSENKTNIDTSIQFANVQELFNNLISFRQDNHI